MWFCAANVLSSGRFQPGSQCVEYGEGDGYVGECALDMAVFTKEGVFSGERGLFLMG